MDCRSLALLQRRVYHVGLGSSDAWERVAENTVRSFLALFLSVRHVENHAMNITRAVSLTDEEVEKLRFRMISEMGGEPDGGFTCDKCTFRNSCELVFDWYNTDGDCLAEK